MESLTPLNLVSIQSIDIHTDEKLPFDLYMNLPLNNKYILFRKKGGVISSSKMEHLGKFKLENFYIQKQDYRTFVEYIAHSLHSLIGADQVMDRLYLEKMFSSSRTLLTSSLKQDDPATAFVLMENITSITSQLIEQVLSSTGEEKRNFYHQIYEMSRNGTSMQKHPIHVSSIVVLLTLGLGYNAKRTISDVAMAALMHDMGLYKLPRRLIQLDHDPSKRLISDRTLINMHPTYALDVLKEKNIFLSELAKTMILQHHEQYNGGGYPEGLKGYQILEFSQILMIADEIDVLIHKTISNKSNFKTNLVSSFQNWQQTQRMDPLLLQKVQKLVL